MAIETSNVQENLRKGNELINLATQGKSEILIGPFKLYRYAYCIFGLWPKITYSVLILGALCLTFAVTDLLHEDSVKEKVEEKFEHIDRTTYGIYDRAIQKALAYQEIGNPERIHKKALNGFRLGLYLLLPSLTVLFLSRRYLSIIRRSRFKPTLSGEESSFHEHSSLEPTTSTSIEQISKLHDLLKSGALTSEEFEIEKKNILGRAV